MDKNNSYLIISIILGFLITLFYIHKFDTIFLGNFILISFIIYVLFYHLGNKDVSENFISSIKEYSDNIENERPIIERERPNNIENERPNNIEKKLPNNFEKKLPFHEEEHSYHHEEEHSYHHEEEHSYHHEEEHSEHKKHKYDNEEEEEEIKDRTFMQQMEEQEEHIREAQKMEEHQEELLHKMEEEEMHIQHKKPIQHKIPSQDNDGYMKKIMDNINNSKTGINSGIGLGISPVTINLSCGGKSDDSNYAPIRPNRPA